MTEDYKSMSESMSLEEINELLARAKALAAAKAEALREQAQAQLELVSEELAELRELDQQVKEIRESASRADSVYEATMTSLRDEHPEVFEAMDRAKTERDNAKSAVKDAVNAANERRNEIKEAVLEQHGFDIFETARRAKIAIKTGSGAGRGRPKGSRRYPELAGQYADGLSVSDEGQFIGRDGAPCSAAAWCRQIETPFDMAMDENGGLLIKGDSPVRKAAAWIRRQS